MAGSFRPPKQWILQEEETITSFANWQSNILYHLSLNNEFAEFIAPAFTWSKQSTTNRGLQPDGADSGIAENARKTAAQKNIQLERMLGLIAQFAPSLLRNEIIKKSVGLNWIWQRLRQHYGFRQSESNFLKLALIKRTDGERYETLYQRLVAHVEDNLLTTDSGITHDGTAVTTNEEMSASCERLVVYLWLTLIDDRLPLYVSRVYAHDLQSKSLKDIQPQLCHSMDSLLADLNAQEDSQINYNKSIFRNKRKDRSVSQYNKHDKRNGSRNSTNQIQKNCVLCKAAGRTYQGHDIGSCWFLSKFDRMEITHSLQVSVDDDTDEEVRHNDDFKAVTSIPVEKGRNSAKEDGKSFISSLTQHVQCDSSPFFYAFFKHHTCKIVIDTGATSSLISNAFAKRVGLIVNPTQHAARQLDKSSIRVSGETKFKISFGYSELSVDGLINDSLDCDILAGVPFCKVNNIDIHLRQEEISIDGKRIPYGSKPDSIQHDVFYADSVILRNDTSKVLYPGEYIEIYSDNLSIYEGEIAIEPRTDSPLQGNWPAPSISRVIQGTVRIPNETEEPIHISKCKHFAQVRKVTIPSLVSHSAQDVFADSNYRLPPTVTSNTKSTFFTSTISIDPDKQFTPAERFEFLQLHKGYDNVFTPNFGVYNDYSGTIRASLNLGPVKPPSTKPRLPFYHHSNMKLLQDEADKLEELGVLAKPEDIGVEVKFASPSFLVKKPDGSSRFVTAFNELGQYTRVLPTIANSCNDVLRRLASWKFIIKTDLTKSFFQIPVAKPSIPYLGTVTPFKGLRVYTRSAMGMPGSSEYLNELLSRVLGDLMQEGFIIVLADDLYIGGDTVPELFRHWSKVLHRMQQNNISLSPHKTVIGPKRTTILGWIWNSGKISVGAHKINPLISAEPPKTSTAMRSFIGAYKAISRCVPNYSSLISPLENAIKGLQGNNPISWTPELIQHFRNAQVALKSPQILTIPTPSDKLIMTVDASPVNDGISASLFVVRNDKRLIGECFSLKLKSHQSKWTPCELEALAITAGVRHFSPYIRESLHPMQILSDSKPSVQAYKKLLKGHFSASSRLSTFLSCLSEYNVVLCHIKGTGNTTSDYNSRHPQVCDESACQICKFVQETCDSVVQSISISDVLSGTIRMPFLNSQAWKSAQHESHDLRKAFAHLTEGTRPSRKAKGLKHVRKYLQIASISDNGLLIVRKEDPFLHQRQLIIVPKDILPGILNALHLYFTHCTEGQLSKLFSRYFYAIGSEPLIKQIVDSCAQCNSMRKLPTELFEQSSLPSPSTVGQNFAADVIKRKSQSIFVMRDIHSSFTTASIIPDEKAPSLRSALLHSSSFLRAPTCKIRVDNATGFVALKDDKVLVSHGIVLDFGNIKNKNKNPSAEKCNQELELELLKVDPTSSPVSPTILQEALHSLNSRIRNRGLSAKEIVLCRDQITHELLQINDNILSKHQESSRTQNHPSSAKSKAGGAPPATDALVQVGSLVYIKSEGDKFNPREQYIITNIIDGQAIIQKCNRGKFMSKSYTVPLNRLFPATSKYQRFDDSSSCSSADENLGFVHDNDISGSDNTLSDEHEDDVVPVDNNLRRSGRQRRAPEWLRSNEWQTD